MTLLVRVAALLAAVLVAGAAFAETRVALVIGNGAYASAGMRLANPPRDAAAIGKTLRDLDFDVEVLTDGTKLAIEDAVGRLARKARSADVTLLFYAGHGLQDSGKNYLMPVDAELKDEFDLRRRFLRLDDILEDMSSAKGARIVMLDACRDNEAVEALRAELPKDRSTAVSRGLAPIPRTSGLLVAFATQPSRVATDGTGTNSPFTAALVKHLGEPGVELRTSLTRVRIAVASATSNTQVPEVSDSLLGEIYLRKSEPVAKAEPPPVPAPAPFDPDMALWSSVSPDRPGDLQAYLDRFPSGIFSGLARNRLAELKAARPEEPAKRVSKDVAVAPPAKAEKPQPPSPPSGQTSLPTPEASLAAEQALAALRPSERQGLFSFFQTKPAAPAPPAQPPATASVQPVTISEPLLNLAMPDGQVQQAIYSKDGSLAVTSSSSGVVRIWDTAAGKLLRAIGTKTRASIPDIAISPDGTRLAVASDNNIKLYDVVSGRQLTLLKGHTSSVYDVTFSPDGSRMLSAGDKTARVWDAMTGKSLLTLTGHSESMSSAKYSPDGTRIVTSASDKTVRLWDAPTGKQQLSLQGHTFFVMDALFSPDGKQIASISWDKTARLWDADTGVSLHTLEGHTDYVSKIAYSPDGTRLLTGGDDKTARLWDTATGTLIATLADHSETVNSVAFSPDGRTVATGSFDYKVRLWDAASGALLATFTGHTNLIGTVAFSPDGTRLLTCSTDGTAKIWDVPTSLAMAGVQAN